MEICGSDGNLGRLEIIAYEISGGRKMKAKENLMPCNCNCFRVSC